MFSKFARFKSALSSKIVAAALALSIAFTPKLANSYSTGDSTNPPASFSIHPLLVEPLREAYHQKFPQSQVDFVTSEIQAGSIKEDSAPSYQRAFHHFLQWQTGEGFKGTFSSSAEWIEDCAAQASSSQGNHCWEKVKGDFSLPVGPFIGINYGFAKHLFDDGATPAHAWNDAHPPGEEVAGGLAQMLGAYSDPYETWTDAHRNQIMSQVHPDLNALPDVKKYSSPGELLQDLATFTGSNFYSADALDGKNPSNCAWDSSHTYCYRDVTDTSGRLVQANVKIVHSGFFTDYPDGECFKEYWPILSAKAIEYELASIQLLFDQTTSCTPVCYDRQCGSDGCGGSCGNCTEGLFCSPNGKCLEECIADCSGKVCGNDGCGGSCGSCNAGYNCNGGQCTKECGPESCGGSCGSCPSGQSCSNGTCVDECVSNCTVPQKQCSGNQVIGCAYLTSSCMQWDFSNPKDCGTDYNCVNGECVYDPTCTPNCSGKECGSNGCGGNCGVCSGLESCVSGTCKLNCNNECSYDGQTYCAGSLIVNCHDYDGDGCLETKSSVCPSAQEHCINGVCTCPTQCAGKECGPDGCGGSCGSCNSGYSCISSSCIEDCVPDCAGSECGNDGCGGSCGTCPTGYYCAAFYGICKPDICTPNCVGKECGSDGCGGTCGDCGVGGTCQDGQCVGSCVSQASLVCVTEGKNNGKYWINSCGVQEGLPTNCAVTDKCFDGRCLETPCAQGESSTYPESYNSSCNGNSVNYSITCYPPGSSSITYTGTFNCFPTETCVGGKCELK